PFRFAYPPPARGGRVYAPSRKSRSQICPTDRAKANDGAAQGRSLGRGIDGVQRLAAQSAVRRLYSAHPCASALRARPAGRSKLLRAVLCANQPISVRSASDLSAELRQLLLDRLVSPVDVIDALDFGGAFGNQSGQHQACRR